MTTQTLNKHPRLVTALQLALLVVVFQGVIGTTPTGHLGVDSAAGASAANVSEVASFTHTVH